MRIFALSDIHVDFQENAAWVQNLSNTDYLDDVIILAGDVSDVESRLRRCLVVLAQKFSQVFFIPGNHDIWIGEKEPYEINISSSIGMGG